jgi:hypothetical protein
VGAGFLHSLTERGGVPHGRAMALALLLCGSASMAGSLSRLQTAASRWVCGLTLLTTVVLVQWPEAGRWLELEPLHLDDWGWVLLLNVLLAGIVRQIAHRK